MLAQFIINGLVKGSLFSILALSFSLVYNTTRIFHIAFAFLYVFASYMMYTFMIPFKFTFFSAAIISLFLTGLMSMFIEFALYQPFEKKNASHNILLLVSLGILIIGVNTIAIIYSNEAKALNLEITEKWEYRGIALRSIQFWQFIISLGSWILILLFLKYRSLGIKIRGLRDNSMLMEVLGFNNTKIRLIVFFISGIALAIPACLISYDVVIDPYIGMPILLNAVVALIIGGVGNFSGPILGGYLLGFIQSFSVYFFEAKWETAISFIILLIFLIFLPNGILGEKQREV